MVSLSTGLVGPRFASAQHAELWSKLKQFSFDQKGPYPFSKRLAKENGWPYEHALAVIEEYRKLLFLLVTVDEQLLAAPDVERCWRLHLIYSMSYFKDLGQGVLGKRIEHDCDDGSLSAAEMSRRFARTLAAYRNVFGPPSEAIWFEPDWAFNASPLPRKPITMKDVRSQISLRAARMVNPSHPYKIVAEHSKLWRDLRDFRFDKRGARYPFSRRLADESFNGDHVYALAAIEEYKKFLFLLGSTGHWVTPSLHVDEAWHLSLDFTRLYWDELMGKVIGKPLHHHPGNGSAEDERKFQAIYQRTLYDYTRHFGEPLFQCWGKIDPRIDWAEILEGTGF